MNPANDEYALFVFDFAANVSRESPFIRIDFARLQRATKGSNHSAGGRGNNVIDRCGMRFADFAFVDAIVFGYSAVHTERHRFFLTR
jgi:hypothetical protein